MKGEKAEIASIVSLIYESVFAPRSWSGFGEQAPGGVGSPVEHGKTAGTLDPALIEHVLPHLERALDLGARQQRLEETRESRINLLQYLPLPVCVVSQSLDLLDATGEAGRTLRQGAVLSQKDGRLYAPDAQFQKNLIEAVASTAATGQTHVLVCREQAADAGTILIAPVSWIIDATEHTAAALFFNFESGTIDGLSAALIDTYDLSRSEAEVAAHLALGLSLDEIAEKKKTSINTIRTQIKNTYAKTKTNRQGELVSLILNGPALWLRLLQTSDEGKVIGSGVIGGSTSFVKLSDDRILSYADYGPRKGTPVFLFHHLLGSLTEKPEDESLLMRLGIRLIVPERPGIGQSTPQEDRHLIDWADDIRQLADHLQLPRFHILGFSSGGPHAAACATLLEDRVETVGLVASLFPVDELPDSAGIGLPQRVLTSIARHWPSGAQSLLEFRYRKILETPDEAVADFKQKGNKADREMLDDPAINAIRLGNLRRARRVPVSLFAHELIILSRPWGFSVSDINVPVKIWHGGQDEYVSAEHARAISALIPNCQTTFQDNWGHFFLYREWERILTELVG